MSDNVSELPVVSEGRLKRRIIWMVSITLAVCLIVLAVVFWDALNFDALGRKIKYVGVSKASDAAVFSFDAHNGNCFADYHDGLAVGSVAGLNVYSKKGDLLFEKQISLTNPAMLVADDNILFYEAGGTTFMLTDGEGKTLLSETVDKTVMDADISPDGSVCYCAPSQGHKTELCVYNNKGSKVYRFNSSSRYLPLCTVSNGAKYAAAVAFSQFDGAFQSFAVVFKTDKEEPLYNIALGNQLIYDIEFMPDNTIICIGEDSLRWMKLDGTLLCSYHYADTYFKDYALSSDGFLALCLNTNKAGNNYSIVTIQKDGTVSEPLSLSEEILDLSANGKYLCVLTAQNLSIYDAKLKLYASTEQTSGYTDVVMRRDGSVLVLGRDRGDIFIP